MPGRRSKGLGSVYRRSDGRWVAEAPRIKGHPREVRYFATEEEAEVGLVALRQAIKQDELPTKEARRESVAAILTRFLAGIEHTIDPESYRRHRDAVTKRLTPTLGSMRAASVTAEDVEAAFSHWRKSPRQSASTLRKTYYTLRMAFDRAVTEKRLTRNVVRDVKPPRTETTEKRALEPEAVSRIIAAAPGLDLGAMWVLAVYTGARLGELLGAKRQDFDLSRRRWHLQRTLSLDASKRLRLSDPKTAASRRPLPLRPVAVAALERHLTVQAEFRKRADWQENELVFCTDLGTLLNPSNVENRHWPLLVKEADLPAWATPHTLRHTYATSLLLSGKPLSQVAHLLGHANQSVTANIYSHLLDRVSDDALDSLDDFYGIGETGGD